MRSSWLCWWLLLTWALLLGQPVSGEEEGDPVPPSEGSEEWVEARQSEEVLDQDEDLEDSLEQDLTEEELLEHRSRWMREFLEEDMEHGYSALQGFRHLAVDYLKKRDDAEYRPLDDSDVEIQKAIGSTIKFRMFVKKGNCTEDPQMSDDDFLDYIMSLHRESWESKRTCEKLDCTFTVFLNGRTHQDAVIDSRCRPLVLAHDLIQHQPYYGSEEEDSASTLDYEDAGVSASSEEEETVPSPYDDDDDADMPPSYEGEEETVPAPYGDDADISASYEGEE